MVITVRNLRMGHWLGIWWFGSKDLFSQFGWAKGVVHSRGLFLEKWILWKSSILKRFIFLVFEYGNLIGVKTHHDRLRNLGKALLNRRFRFIDFGRGWGPHECFGCCLIVALSSFYLLCLRVFENFLIPALDCPFRVFTLKSHFFFFLSFLFFHCPIMHLKIYPEQVNILSRWFWLNNRDSSLVGYENFSRKNLFSLSIHIQSK